MFLGEKEKCRRGTGLYEAVQKMGCWSCGSATYLRACEIGCSSSFPHQCENEPLSAHEVPSIAAVELGILSRRSGRYRTKQRGHNCPPFRTEFLVREVDTK